VPPAVRLLLLTLAAVLAVFAAITTATSPGDAIPASVEAIQLNASIPPPGDVPSTETSLKREYIWGPGDSMTAGLDELLVQFDDSRFPWWPLQDGGGDIVALAEVPNPATGPSASNLARVVGQWQYDAYGSVLSAETFATASGRTVPLMHCGHKGLFFDRLDSGGSGGGGVVDPVTLEDRPRHIPYAHTIYNVRNRAYQPALGRWMQQDPNATAMSLIEAASHSGRGVGAIALAMSAEDRYGDGYNLYEYLGSSPWDGSDPLGLYDFEDGFEDVTDVLGMLDPVPGPSDFIRGMLNAMVGDYGANLDWDVEWAGDWSLDDDDHSRIDNTWVAVALMRGLYDAFEISLPGGDETFNPLHVFGNNFNAGKKAGAGGQTRFTRIGQQAHRNYKSALGQGYDFEVTIKGVGRADAVDFPNRIVRELKPDTPTGRALGVKQANKYARGLEKQHGHPPGSWTAIVDLYRP